MKKIIIALIAMMFIIPCGCKKGGITGKDSTLAKKYAKYKVQVSQRIKN